MAVSRDEVHMNDIDILKDYEFYIAKSVDEVTSFITEQLDNAIRKAFLSTGIIKF